MKNKYQILYNRIQIIKIINIKMKIIAAIVNKTVKICWLFLTVITKFVKNVKLKKIYHLIVINVMDLTQYMIENYTI